MNQGRKKMVYVRGGAETCDVSASAAGTRTARGGGGPGASNLKNFEI